MKRLTRIMLPFVLTAVSCAPCFAGDIGMTAAYVPPPPPIEQSSTVTQSSATKYTAIDVALRSIGIKVLLALF